MLKLGSSSQGDFLHTLVGILSSSFSGLNLKTICNSGLLWIEIWKSISLHILIIILELVDPSLVGIIDVLNLTIMVIVVDSRVRFDWLRIKVHFFVALKIRAFI